VAFTKSDNTLVDKPEAVDLMQIIPLILAAALLTVGLSMFLSGTQNGSDLVQPVIVVFGGTTVAILATFSLSQIGLAMQLAVTRGIRGGTSPSDMVRAMMKICDVSRRAGLQGVGEIQSNSASLNEACFLISEAADEQRIQFRLDKQRTTEQVHNKMTTDVFLFIAIYSFLIGGLATLFRLVTNLTPAMNGTQALSQGMVVLPLVCGTCLALLMAILIGRLRSAHLRELVSTDVAFQGALVILEDNNVQRLRARLTTMLPLSMR